jgi:hypothetical protein
MSGALITRSGNALLPVPGLARPNAVGSDLPALHGKWSGCGARDL